MAYMPEEPTAGKIIAPIPPSFDRHDRYALLQLFEIND